MGSTLSLVVVRQYLRFVPKERRLIDLALDNDLDSDDEELLNELGLGHSFHSFLASSFAVVLTFPTEMPTMPEPADPAWISKMMHDWQHAVEV